MDTPSPALLRTDVGRKMLVAASGAVLWVFLVFHLLGNLQLFAGPAALNAYGVFLRRVPALLWVVRGGLLLSLGVHAWLVARLAWSSWRARPLAYVYWRPTGSTLASRTMRWTGPLVLLFVVYHLLHVTWGTVHHDFRPEEPYHNLVSALRLWPVALVYGLAMVPLFLHLDHSLWAMFQSLGLQRPASRWRRAFATTSAAGLAAGFTLLPASILLGWVGP